MKLYKHLQINPRPLSSKSSFIFWNNYRITVLFDRLIRVEENAEKVFNDNATQAIWYRDMKPVAFTYKEIDPNSLEIKTSALTFTIRRPFFTSTVLIDRNEVLINNDENLFGTYKTLDGYNGWKNEHYTGNGDEPVLKLDPGVVGKNGVALYDDSKSLSINDDGTLSPAISSHQDYYIFAYGHDYRAAVKALYALSGPVPLLPRYSLGNWWSRYFEYTEKEYLKVLLRFAEKDIPLTIATIDMDWHYNSYNIEKELHITALGRNEAFYGGNDGWTGYSWNKTLFPDYKSFLKKIKKMGLKITLNLHPALGVRWFEDFYPSFAKAMGKDPQTLEQIPFDFTNNNYINNYFKILHHPYEKDGVDFWWIDWQQGDKSKLAGLDPLWALNHYHYLDITRNNRSSIILSRYAGIGSHRYPIGFSGDTFITWDTLKFLPYFTATASNAGFTHWSHDIGGHQGGITDAELYLRFVQLGVFSPINRLHCQNSLIMSKEPWRYLNGTGLIATEFLRLRHKLIPHLYTSNYVTHEKGLALIEPIYYESNDSRAYNYPNQALFAQNAYILPITEKIDEYGLAKVEGFFLKGNYVDFFTRDVYQFDTDKEVTLYRSLDSFPYMLKAGAFVPLGEHAGNSIKNPEILTVITSTGNGKYNLIEDKMSKNRLEKSITSFTNTNLDNKQITEIEFDNAQKVNGKKRIIKMSYIDITEAEITLKVNGKNHEFEIQNIDDVTIVLEVDNVSKYCVEIAYKTDRLQQIKTQIQNIFYGLTGENHPKIELFDLINKCKDVDQIRTVVETSTLSKSQIGRIIEFL